jgi:hypothetical protein
LKHFITIILSCFLAFGNHIPVFAQEAVAPLMYNSAVAATPVKAKGSANKTTALSLPFFEDFLDYSPFPNTDRWVERYVYVNNTMGENPISRGVATFDGLNEKGIPYNPVNNLVLVYADTLTSREIDLSGKQPGDSIYLSFFYQPQGNGFYPEAGDSLIVYMRRKNNTWAKVWAKEGSTSYPFDVALVPVADTSFFYDAFQFRFLNKASMNTNDDVWNIDYIRLDAGRNMYDTLVNDIAMSTDPTYLLGDYTSMPYQQFLANPGKERAAQHMPTVSNNTNSAQAVRISYSSRDRMSGTPLGSDGPADAIVKEYGLASVVFNTYSTTVPMVYRNNWVSFDNTYYMESSAVTGMTENDTIVKSQVFHNYLSYDDGSAEKSYFLNLFPTLPGKLAIEHHLNIPDTLTGIAIYFGRQVPLANLKTFSVQIYTELAVNGGTDKLFYQQDFLEPGYLNTNNFYVYKFDYPVALPAGTFYVGTMQPALGNSDSLYFGLDANRETGNHAYYNVVGNWEGSTINGAIMIRPIIGPIIPSAINEVAKKNIEWSVNPNPATDIIRITAGKGIDPLTRYQLLDMQGRVLKAGNVSVADIEVSTFAPGLYFVRLVVDGQLTAPKKIFKL